MKKSLVVLDHCPVCWSMLSAGGCITEGHVHAPLHFGRISGALTGRAS